MNLVLVAIMGMTMTSCMSINVKDGSVDKTPSQVTEINKVTAMQPFTGVGISGAFKVIYEQGAQHSVRVDASEQALKEMTVYVKDGELRIRKAVKVTSPSVSFGNVKIYVTSPDIKDIDLAGSGLFAASNAINAGGDLNMEIAGSGKVMLADVTCKDTHMEIAGSGNIEIGKMVIKDAHAEIAGSGDINMATLLCNKLSIDIAGSGNVNCEDITADDVDVDIAGSGDVNLKGTVKHHTKDIAGSGKVNIIETAAPQPIQ